MTTEQQVHIYLFSNFIITIFLVLILTVTQISNTASLTSVTTPYTMLLSSSPFSAKMWKLKPCFETSTIHLCMSSLGGKNILD